MSPGSAHPSRIDSQHAIWEREMRRLAAGIRLLVVVLVALLARTVISGPTFANGLAALISAALIVMSWLLARFGRRHEPPS
jgi:hypothetical protein